MSPINLAPHLTSIEFYKFLTIDGRACIDINNRKLDIFEIFIRFPVPPEKPISVKLVPPHLMDPVPQGKLRECDLITLGPHPVLSARAYETVGRYLQEDAEFYPLECLDCINKYYFLLKLRREISIDITKSDVDRMEEPPHQIFHVNRFAFRMEDIKDVFIFDEPVSRSTIITPKFVEILRQENLTGLDLSEKRRLDVTLI